MKKYIVENGKVIREAKDGEEGIPFDGENKDLHELIFHEGKIKRLFFEKKNKSEDARIRRVKNNA